jgi:hypothetical protein
MYIRNTRDCVPGKWTKDALLAQGGIFLCLGIHRGAAGMGSFLTSQIYQWDAIFIYLLYQWVDNLTFYYINGW